MRVSQHKISAYTLKTLTVYYTEDQMHVYMYRYVHSLLNGPAFVLFKMLESSMKCWCARLCFLKECKQIFGNCLWMIVCVGWLVSPVEFCCSANQYCSSCWFFFSARLTYAHSQIFKPVNMCIHYMHHKYASICTQSHMHAHAYTPQAQVYINMLHNYMHTKVIGFSHLFLFYISV